MSNVETFFFLYLERRILSIKPYSGIKHSILSRHGIHISQYLLRKDSWPLLVRFYPLIYNSRPHTRRNYRLTGDVSFRKLFVYTFNKFAHT